MEISRLLPPCRLSDSDLLSALDAAVAAVSALKAWSWRAGAELEERGLAKELGAKDTIEFLSMRHRHNTSDIRRELKLAKKLPNYAAVSAALPDPQTVPPPGAPPALSPAHAQVIIWTLEKAPATVPVEDLRVAEEQMIEVARIVSPDELRAFGREVLARLDTDGPEPSDEDPYREEYLWLKPVEGGVKIRGYLAAEHAELLKTELYNLAKPHKTVDGELDPRSRDKRQADALVTILEVAVGATATPGIPGVPHLTVTIDFSELQAATAHAVGEFVFGDNLSAAAVRILACDAKILPIVLGSDSQPLDVGMEQRFVSRAIRRGLNKRDKGCVVCHAPPSSCHAHHVIHWIDGGPTSITNLVLVCGAHHRAIHAGHWKVAIINGVVDVTRPTWTEPAPVSPAALIQDALQRHSPPATGLNPHGEEPGWSCPTPLPSASSPADGLSWLTPESVADLDPWGDSGTPSAGP